MDTPRICSWFFSLYLPRLKFSARLQTTGIKRMKKPSVGMIKIFRLNWPLTKKVIVSEKDRNGITFEEAQYFK